MFEQFFSGGRNTGGPIKSRGLGRVLGIIMDNMTRFLLSNLICLACLAAGAAAVWYALSQNSAPLLLGAGFLGGMLLGPAYGAMSDGMLQAVRGVPGRWWYKYRRALKRDWKDCLLPGAFTGLLIALLAYEFVILGVDASLLPSSIYICTAITVAVALAVFTYFWPQRVFSDLKMGQIFRNCMLMIMAHPATALKTVLVQALYWGLVVAGFPYSVIALPILGLWFPQLMGLLVVYPQLNTDFKIEERLGEEI